MGIVDKIKEFFQRKTRSEVSNLKYEAKSEVSRAKYKAKQEAKNDLKEAIKK